YITAFDELLFVRIHEGHNGPLFSRQELAQSVAQYSFYKDRGTMESTLCSQICSVASGSRGLSDWLYNGIVYAVYNKLGSNPQLAERVIAELPADNKPQRPVKFGDLVRARASTNGKTASPSNETSSSEGLDGLISATSEVIGILRDAGFNPHRALTVI